jgi:hypothetical protein
LAKLDHCPICDVAVRPENLVRHLSEIHPHHPDTANLVEKAKAEPGRIVARAPSRPLRITRLQTIIVIVLILAGVGGYYLATHSSGPPPPLPCISGAGQAYHWHTQLTITSGGNPVTIPADIGISFTCMQVLHTHDTSGLIHIEPDTPAQARVYSLGDFFAVWGKPFGSPTRMTANGTAVNPSPSQGLYNGETIVLDYVSFTP